MVFDLIFYDRIEEKEMLCFGDAIKGSSPVCVALQFYHLLDEF